MGDRLLEGRAAKGLIAGLAPPFDREVVEASLGKMMGYDFRLEPGGLWLIAKDFGGPVVQRPAAAPEQTFISRVLDQRVLEAIVRLRRGAFDEEDIRVG